MKLSAATSLAASALILMTAVPAGAQRKPTPTAGAAAAPTVTGQSTTAIEPPVAPPGPRPLFTAGDVNVGVWAPVQPPYNANANRNQAANPIWAEGGDARPGF